MTTDKLHYHASVATHSTRKIPGNVSIFNLSVAKRIHGMNYRYYYTITDDVEAG